MDLSRQQLSSSSMSITNDICNDIILEILSWLPVDSLLRFKSVSKSWFSLITNPMFVKLHIDHQHLLATTTTGGTQIHNPANIMFISKKRYNLMSMDKVVSSSTSTVLEKIKMAYPFDFPKHSLRIVGSCNGLICISAYDHVDRNDIVCLWNPCTKEFKLLPSHDAPLEFPSYHGNAIRREGYKVARYGFGYDHVMKDYKVIASVQFFGFGINAYHYELRVYTLGTDSWRRIHGTPYKREYYRKTPWLHVNGAFHRIVELSSSDIRILSFDIVEEVHREVPNPKCLDCSWPKCLGCSLYESELTVLRGCLCLCFSAYKWSETKWTHTNHMMEVWMMMNYGVKDSWTKLFNITNIVVDSHLLKPVWFCRNGELLIEVDNSKLLIYDPKHNELAKMLKFRSNIRFETEIYIASLVSLKSQKEIEKELIC